VQQVEDHIEDNEVGKINQKQNWGNSIVIRHAEGLYTKMSHLRKDSFKVKTGDHVKQGDVVAACGNSGRSPEPHLHFQVQTTPYIGSKTFAYPLAYYITEKHGVAEIREFSVPGETEIVNNISPNPSLKQAFEFLPGYILTVKAEGMKEAKWEIFTDAWNNTYFYCHYTKAIAYFKRNESIFYFTAFEGDKNSLLYYFYLAAYKIFLSTEPALPAIDKFPLQLSSNNMTKWLQDIVSPFVIFSRLHYESLNKTLSNDFLNPAISIESRQTLQFMSIRKITQQFEIAVKDNRILSFTFIKNKKTITAICTPKDY
jgi:Peptidase family M23